MNFQESTAILNAWTKKSGNLLNVPRIPWICHLLVYSNNITKAVQVIVGAHSSCIMIVGDICIASFCVRFECAMSSNSGIYALPF